MKKIIIFVVFLLINIFFIFSCSHTFAENTDNKSKGELMKNIYSQLPDRKLKNEVFIDLLKKKNIKIEKIVSTGQTTPENRPYFLEQDEWVIVLKGSAELWIDGKGTFKMNEGDYIFIPRHTKHRVTYTSEKPPAVWLAVHIF